MGRFEQYGVTGAPNGMLTTLALGWLNAWTYNYRDINNELRDSSTRFHSYADELLGKYTAQLKEDLKKLRNKLLASTRENPFPPQENFDTVNEFEGYMRKVESVRTRIINAPRPPKEYIYHSGPQNIQLLMDLNTIDRDIIQTLSTVTPETIDGVESLLEKRALVLRDFQVI